MISSIPVVEHCTRAEYTGFLLVTIKGASKTSMTIHVLKSKLLTNVLGVVESAGVAIPDGAFLLFADRDRVNKRVATSAWDGGFTGVPLVFVALGVFLGLRDRALSLTLVVVKTPRMIPRGVVSSICLEENSFRPSHKAQINHKINRDFSLV